MNETRQWCKVLGIAEGAPPLEVCAAFEKLAMRLAPRDLTMPVYCVLAELSPAFAGCFDSLAYYSARKQLPADCGPGVVLFTSGAILKRVPPQYAIEVLCLTLAHELGHALCAIASGDFAEWQEALADVTDHPALASAAAKRFSPMVDQQQTKADRQLEAHGLRFTRIIAHLDYRLRCAGVHSEHLAAGERYNQRPYSECVEALGGEPAKCINKSFAEILDTPAPPEYQACVAAAA